MIDTKALNESACIISHALVQNVFWCEEHKTMVQRPELATVYVGEEARMAGIEAMREVYPQMLSSQVIFHYAYEVPLGS